MKGNLQFITLKEAAELAEVHVASIYLAVKEGRLPHTTIYGKKLVIRGDVLEYKQTAGQRNGTAAKKGLQVPKRRRGE